MLVRLGPEPGTKASMVSGFGLPIPLTLETVTYLIPAVASTPEGTVHVSVVELTYVVVQTVASTLTKSPETNPDPVTVRVNGRSN